MQELTQTDVLAADLGAFSPIVLAQPVAAPEPTAPGALRYALATAMVVVFAGLLEALYGFAHTVRVLQRLMLALQVRLTAHGNLTLILLGVVAIIAVKLAS